MFLDRNGSLYPNVRYSGCNFQVPQQHFEFLDAHASLAPTLVSQLVSHRVTERPWTTGRHMFSESYDQKNVVN